MAIRSAVNDAKAANYPIVDMHADVAIDVERRRRQGETHVLETVFLPLWREGAVRGSFITVGGDSPPQCRLGTHFPLESAITLTEALIADVQESSHAFVIVRGADDVEAALSTGKFFIVLHAEGSRPFERDLSILRLWHHIGLRSVALTWNARNLLADGAKEQRTGGGLTQRGIAFVREVGSLGMILDLAHLSEAGFWDAIEHYAAPVLVSHAACRALHNHDRNLSDEQIRAIASTGGMVGITFSPAMIGEGDATIESIVRHIAHAAELVGPGHVGIGADFWDYIADIVRPSAHDPNVGFRGGQFPPDLNGFASMQNLVPQLLSSGFTEQEARGVLGENAIRVSKAILGGQP